ncbi:hypothetical protein POM88_053036 [Heracleum sosnowskyi]|uniref:Replication factor A C-terminal domain-containing protein n=1 Tax=Heracleum sosnowskyi TaxID=360622 RepID=A0AAD8LW03_9APIA|nr:hypothetical protein POM88_053036 [Heracleum sosnowskyi]
MSSSQLFTSDDMMKGFQKCPTRRKKIRKDKENMDINKSNGSSSPMYPLSKIFNKSTASSLKPKPKLSFVNKSLNIQTSSSSAVRSIDMECINKNDDDTMDRQPLSNITNQKSQSISRSQKEKGKGKLLNAESTRNLFEEEFQSPLPERSDDYYDQLEHSIIGDSEYNEDGTDDSNVITHATIRYVDDKGNWYYHICTGCKEQIQSIRGDFICSKCNRRIPQPEKKFRISIIGSDESGCIEIHLEDREVRTLLGKRAETMYKEQMGDQTFPKLLKNLEKTDITVKIFAKDGNIRNKDSVYYANNICKGFYTPEVEEAEPSTSTQQTTTQVHRLKGPFALINCAFEEAETTDIKATTSQWQLPISLGTASADHLIDSDDELMKQIDEYKPDLAEYKRTHDEKIEKSLTNLNVNLATMTMQVTELCKNHEEYCANFKAQVPMMMEEIMRLNTQVDQLRKQINRPV